MQRLLEDLHKQKVSVQSLAHCRLSNSISSQELEKFQHQASGVFRKNGSCIKLLTLCLLLGKSCFWGAWFCELKGPPCEAREATWKQ